MKQVASRATARFLLDLSLDYTVLYLRRQDSCVNLKSYVCMIDIHRECLELNFLFPVHTDTNFIGNNSV
jgi:hypothetical protein